MHMLERKRRYDGTVAEYACRFIRREGQELILLYVVPESFRIEAVHETVHIPPGTVTVAYYWEERPYNAYHWRAPDGTYLGTYFNLVRETAIAHNAVTYEDLIVDIMVLPSGHHAVLDLDELPQPLSRFEHGDVARHVRELIEAKDEIVRYLMRETDRLIAARQIHEIQPMSP